MEQILPLYLLIFILGAAFGSFFNVCIHRIPRKESIIFPSSHCPTCNNSIKPWHNLPILSFLILKGKCANCGKRISWRYPLVELITPILFILLFNRFGLSLAFLKYTIFFSLSIIIFFIDIDYQIIPDILSLPLIPLGLILSLISTDVSITSSLIGGFAGFIFFYLIMVLYPLIRGKEGMGGGDTKYIAGIGTFLGIPGVLFSIFISSILALFVLLPLRAGKKVNLKNQFPYGPFLVTAAIIYVLVGYELIDAYLSFYELLRY